MKDKKSLISKCLLGGGLLVLICGIFCFFGSATAGSAKEAGAETSFVIGSLFAFMFGTDATLSFTIAVPGIGSESDTTPVPGKLVGGTTALFAIEMVIIVLAIILLIGIFAKKLQKKHITIGCCIVCVLAVAAVVLAFCSKKMVIDTLSEGQEVTPEILDLFKLGSAGISYGVLGIVGILATGAGLFLGKDQAIGA